MFFVKSGQIVQQTIVQQTTKEKVSSYNYVAYYFNLVYFVVVNDLIYKWESSSTFHGFGKRII